jgi:hypothetical protein
VFASTSLLVALLQRDIEQNMSKLEPTYTVQGNIAFDNSTLAIVSLACAHDHSSVYELVQHWHTAISYGHDGHQTNVHVAQTVDVK